MTGVLSDAGNGKVLLLKKRLLLSGNINIVDSAGETLTLVQSFSPESLENIEKK